MVTVIKIGKFESVAVNPDLRGLEMQWHDTTRIRNTRFIEVRGEPPDLKGIDEQNRPVRLRKFRTRDGARLEVIGADRLTFDELIEAIESTAR